jgi:hypothetical protein
MNFQSIKRNLIQIPGFKTNRKIVVIESDDWGSIRTSSKLAYNLMLDNGIAVDKDLYCKYDSLESEEDLSALFTTLVKFKDKMGNHPIITANTIVANPDFDKIKKSNFEEYHYEIFTNTLERYHGNSKTFELWKQGIKENLFRPQFHGREHVNINMWMNSLKADNKEMHLAFDNKMFGIPLENANSKRNNYMAAFDFTNINEMSKNELTIVDGLKIFSNLFGFRSDTIIAPCYVWSDQMNPMLKEQGIKGFQGISYQNIPEIGKKKYHQKFHYNGQTNSIGQKYLVRNAFFEPTHFTNQDSVKEIISRMNTAFYWKKPLIIGSHRINFMGSLDPNNRKTNLQKLELVLEAILKKCPDVEFMSSDALVNILLKDKYHDSK